MKLIIDKVTEIKAILDHFMIGINGERTFFKCAKRLRFLVDEVYGVNSEISVNIQNLEDAIKDNFAGVESKHLSELKVIVTILLDKIEISQLKKDRNNTTISFVNSKRIKELQLIKNNQFDLKKLIQLCKEINDNYCRKNYLSVGMIGRTIMNHIPPIFNFQKFDEVINNYKGSKSFKDSMKHLSEQRAIADNYLHQTIRSHELIPNSTQIDFRQSLDVLLEEIVVKLNEPIK